MSEPTTLEDLQINAIVAAEEKTLEVSEAASERFLRKRLTNYPGEQNNVGLSGNIRGW